MSKLTGMSPARAGGDAGVRNSSCGNRRRRNRSGNTYGGAVGLETLASGNRFQALGVLGETGFVR